jgi:RNA polymerase sigma-70 factor (ECF subfamily)
MAGPTFEEKASVEAARRGDVDAFNLLVELYQRLAYNVAYRTLGSPEEACDAMQDAFLSAFRALGEFRGGSFKAWLLRIVVNACYDQLRRRQRHPTSSLDALAEEGEATTNMPPDPGPGPELEVLRGETAEVIQQALGNLATDQRVVVVLCDVQGLSYEEAAAALEVPVGTIKSRLSRARAHLRDELAARGELPAAVLRPHKEDLATT